MVSNSVSNHTIINIIIHCIHLSVISLAKSLQLTLIILYIVLTICLLIGYEPTANFGNQHNLQIS